MFACARPGAASIKNVGSAVIRNCSLQRNTVAGTAPPAPGDGGCSARTLILEGGALSFDGTASALMEGCIASGNTVEGGDGGFGAISVGTNLTVRGLQATANSAGGFGGAFAVRDRGACTRAGWETQRAGRTVPRLLLTSLAQSPRCLLTATLKVLQSSFIGHSAWFGGFLALDAPVALDAAGAAATVASAVQLRGLIVSGNRAVAGGVFGLTSYSNALVRLSFTLVSLPRRWDHCRRMLALSRRRPPPTSAPRSVTQAPSALPSCDACDVSGNVASSFGAVYATPPGSLLVTAPTEVVPGRSINVTVGAFIAAPAIMSIFP